MESVGSDVLQDFISGRNLSTASVPASGWAPAALAPEIAGLHHFLVRHVQHRHSIPISVAS